MTNKSPSLRLTALALVTALASVSCSTVYDQQGNARTVVTPEGAIAGAAVAGLIGYQISKNRHKSDNNHRRYHNGYQNGYRPYNNASRHSYTAPNCNSYGYR